jgi:hypothetical protein
VHKLPELVIVFKNKKSGWGHNLVLEHLPSMYKALGSISSTEKNKIKWIAPQGTMIPEKKNRTGSQVSHINVNDCMCSRNGDWTT